MATDADGPEAHFPLNMIKGGLGGFALPEGPFDPEGAWESVYAIATLAGNYNRVGELRLKRTPGKRGRFVLTLEHTKVSPGEYRQRTSAELECRPDPMSTPTRWSFASETQDRHGNPVPSATLRKWAVAKKRQIRFDDDGHSARRVDTPDAFTVNWALFDAVQRLPREAFGPLLFTLIDHFDQPKGQQTLSFRTSVRLMLGGRCVKRQQYMELEKGRIRKTHWAREGDRPVRLHAYDHVGRGIVPWVYWVDASGRLLFAVAGLEAYVLQSSKGL